jgi:hypothetical protein
MTDQPNNVSAAGVLKRFVYTASVESTYGHQSFYIDATTREEADERAARNDTDAIYAEEIEVQDLGKLVFDNETTTDDFGQFQPSAAASAQATGQAGGWKLAMRVLQSDLYGQLDDAERAECDALVRANPYIAAPSPAAREAGDRVTLTDEQRHSLEFAVTLLESRGYTGRAKDLRALLREAGSR